MDKKYLTIKEAAKFLGVTPLTLRNWDKSGKFSTRRHPISNYRIYRLQEIEALLKEIEDGDSRRIKLSKPKFKKLEVKLIED
jgi:DNA-binding transcriptional MerR regulator